ncbi:DUF4123 domain-containing protein [Cupriavidus campinensis]
MFFAVAQYHPQLAAQVLLTWQERLARKPDLHFYALIDCLMEESFPEFCRAQGWPAPLSVYAGQIGFDNARHVSPSLLPLPEPPALLKPVLPPLLARCSGKPTLAFLVSAHPVEVVKAQLMCVARITDGDGESWVLRFGDARVWPPPSGWLTAEQHDHAFAGIDAWMAVNRHGQLRILDGRPDIAPADPDDFVRDFRVTEQQFAQMIGWSEADAHLARLAGTSEHAELTRSPIEQYDTARQCLATLDRLAIDADQDRYQYIRFALQFPGDCERHPAVANALLMASQKQADLPTLLEGVTVPAA